METYNFNGMTELDFSEMMAIDGGSAAYDKGYAIGKAISDFFQGLADGLMGK